MIDQISQLLCISGNFLNAYWTFSIYALSERFYSTSIKREMGFVLICNLGTWGEYNDFVACASAFLWWVQSSLDSELMWTTVKVWFIWERRLMILSELHIFHSGWSKRERFSGLYQLQEFFRPVACGGAFSSPASFTSCRHRSVLT